MSATTIVEAVDTDGVHLHQEVAAKLDAALASFQDDDAAPFMVRLIDGLGELKARFGSTTFADAIIPLARAHAVGAIVVQDPFTTHSFTQPRGYPGDADLLDIIYRHPAAAHRVGTATPAGKAVNAFCLEVAACRAVRERRDILAARLDGLGSASEVLSLACGHLREAELSVAVRDGRIARFVAADQDERSLAVIAAEALSPAIKPERVRVRDVITGAAGSLGRFDFIYAAGLYDYLDGRTAAVLTARLFDHLKPGGRLLIGNYLPGLWEQPYMEAFLAWPLIYRSREEIAAFGKMIDPALIAGAHDFGDQSGCVGYVELIRAAAI